MSAVEATLILPLQGGAEQALRCLRSLAALPEAPVHEVVIVDDASVGLEDLLARLAGDVDVVRVQRRVGFARAAALGAERARGEVLVLLRGAPEVAGDWLAPLVAALADPGLAAAASVTAGEARPHPASALALAVRRADVAAAGGLPEVADEAAVAALCVELASRGGRAAVVPASVVRAPGARMVGTRLTPGEASEVSIVVPTLDAASERVRACVAAVQATTDAAHEIVIVDNGAPPQGFSAPVNQGVRAARGRWVVVMNDDVETLPGWWPPLREALEAGADVAFPLTVDGVARRDFAAWCFAFGQPAIERFGHAPGEFFDPSFRVWFQDTDLLTRMQRDGAAPVLVERSRIRHGLSETVGSDDPELRAWIDREIALDRERFQAKHPDVGLVRIELDPSAHAA